MPFRDVSESYGNRRSIDLLARSIAREALPPSLIFAGPGAGKRPAAIAVAQALNCLTPQRAGAAEASSSTGPGIDACGGCAQCVRIVRGVHPDILVIEPSESGSIKIDAIRDAVDRTGYRPFEGRRRVVIIDEADSLVPAAQNALLKTLEEPPRSCVFVLITARPDVLLPTVRSRCIRLMFAQQSIEAADADAREVARRVLTQVVGGSDAKRLDAARELLTKTGGTSASDREQVASHLRAMASLIRDIEAIGASADAAVLANADMRPVLERLEPAYRTERGLAAFDAVERALDAIDRNVGVKVVADWLVLQL